MESLMVECMPAGNKQKISRANFGTHRLTDLIQQPTDGACIEESAVQNRNFS